MSAPLIAVFVMKTLIAPTTTGLTAVHVNKDSLEMEYSVQVCKNSSIFHKCVRYQTNVVCLLLVLLQQISMSAPLILVPVMKTLIAATVKVLIVVLVNKDSVEMEQFVKVCKKT